MEGLNPALDLLLTVKRSLERGQSVKTGVIEYIQTSQDPLTVDVAKWYNLYQQGLATDGVLHKQISIYRQSLLQTLEKGLAGEPIYTQIQVLEEEIVRACEDSLARSLGQLPFILLIPLLLFQLPAFLLLLFGPILTQFLSAMGGR